MATRPMDVRERFAEFYKTFQTVKGEPKYRLRIQQMAISNSISLYIDFEDLLEYDKDLAEGVIKRPKEYVEAASNAVWDVMKTENRSYAERVSRFHARFRRLIDVIPIRSIRSSLIHRLIAVEGIITRSSTVKQQIVEAAFLCERCNETIRLVQADRTFTTPVRCTNPECKGRGPFRLMVDESRFIDWQRLTLQERPEELPPGQLPRSIEVIVRDDLVDTVRPGDRVTLTGILELRQEVTPKGGRGSTFTTYIEANSIDVTEKGFEEVEVTPEDEEKILEAAKDPWIVSKIVNSIAPSIYGLQEVKEAIAYLLFGGRPKVLPDGVRIRGDLNVLIIGDPGTGKSQLLQYVAKLAPRGIYTSGKGSTAAGLTAAVTRDRVTGDFYLEAGALVLADGGVAAIDEIDKMRQEDRVAIHEAMEQQTVSIAKAGIVATLNARSSILAAANPALGRYVEQRPVSENINLPVTILSRFDFIFILKDKPDTVTDTAMVDHVLRLHSVEEGAYQPTFPPEFLRKYIAYARRKVNPKLTLEAEERIKRFFLDLRSKAEAVPDSPVPITLRQLESLIRAMEARARIALREEVTVEDAEAAIRLMQTFLNQVGYDRARGVFDIDTLMVGKPKSLQEKFMQVLDIVVTLEKEGQGAPVSKEAILEEAGRRGLDSGFVERALRQLKSDGTLYEPKEGFYKKV
ncbi:MAG: minichromosome maintenance protein MCM [Candidatus Nezhaarchaeales archaeon]